MARGGSAPFSPVVDGRKTCSLCKINKPVGDFYKRGGARDGYQAGCRACWAVNFKAAKITDPLREFRRYRGHCNRMLGYARDSAETLRAAIDYLGGQ